MRSLRLWARWAFVVAMAAGTAHIALGCLSYFTEGELHPFVLEKESLPLESVYLFALYVHIVTAIWSLPACLALISSALLRSWPRVHRWLGRVTGAVVLLALVPSGSWLAMFAKGGVLSTLGFLLSGAIVFVAMIAGIRTARAGDFVAHRRCTVHVLAQLSVAVTSRALLVGFDYAGVDAELAYLIALWVPVIMSVCAAELLAGRSCQKEGETMKKFAYILVCSTLLVSTIAGATPEPQKSAGEAKELVEAEFLQPLQQRERARSRYSRVSRAPAERRVTITDEALIEDSSGASFVSFSIEERRHGKWVSAMSGCTYLEEGTIFVKKGDKLRPAAAYLGKSDEKVTQSACVPATVAHTAS